jgi:hypothetical protein
VQENPIIWAIALKDMLISGLPQGFERSDPY